MGPNGPQHPRSDARATSVQAKKGEPKQLCLVRQLWSVRLGGTEVVSNANFVFAGVMTLDHFWGWVGTSKRAIFFMHRPTPRVASRFEGAFLGR